MLSRSSKLLALTVLISVLVGGNLPAAQTAITTIRVRDMHCENCATKIRRKLFTVPGVVNVQTSVKANRAVVMPQQTKQPSPRALWEAVEQAGFEPVHLEGPAGTFTTKPRR